MRRGPEVAPAEPQGRPDVLLDVALVRISGELLDDPSQIYERRIAVAEPGPRPKNDLLIGHHRHQLLPAGRLERLPGQAPPVRPGGILEAGGVGEEHANGDLIDRPEAVVDLPQLRHVAGDLVVQCELAPVAQLHDGDGGERFGDRGPVEDGALLHPLLPIPVSPAVLVVSRNLPIIQKKRAGADYAVALSESVEGPDIP